MEDITTRWASCYFPGHTLTSNGAVVDQSTGDETAAARLMNLRCDLDFDFAVAAAFFQIEQQTPYTLVEISEEDATVLLGQLPEVVRRCYVTDAALEERSRLLGVPIIDVLKAKLPDPGSVMAGDFGEILVYIFESSRYQTGAVTGPKKWRLKQDRRKPAPHSDVVHFLLPTWPIPSDSDAIICSEVKTKSTASSFRPVDAAIEGTLKDRTSRLARTLTWLRERAVTEGLGDISIDQLDRFLHADLHPEARKKFQAVAVVCASVVDAVLEEAPPEADSRYDVVIIRMPALRTAYMSVFETALLGDGLSHARDDQ
jgi:hypothetical protein